MENSLGNFFLGPPEGRGAHALTELALRCLSESFSGLRSTNLAYKLAKGFTFCFCAVLLGGCSATGPKFTAQEVLGDDEAMLYVYRPDLVYFKARVTSISVDGQLAAELRNNGYIAIKLRPGQYEVTQKWNEWLLDRGKFDSRAISMKVALKPGQSVYLRLISHASLTWEPPMDRYVSTWVFEHIEPARAKLELASTQREELDPAFSRLRQ